MPLQRSRWRGAVPRATRPVSFHFLCTVSRSSRTLAQEFHSAEKGTGFRLRLEFCATTEMRQRQLRPPDLRLSLLRSPTWPDPTADRGHHSFSYSLYVHNGDWKQALTVRRGYEFNYKLIAEQAEIHTGMLPAEHSFVNINDDHLVLTAVKKAEDANALLVRFYEWAGKTGDVHLTVPEGATAAQLTNLMEHPVGQPLSITGTDEITIPVHPYEIVSVRVDYAQP